MTKEAFTNPAPEPSARAVDEPALGQETGSPAAVGEAPAGSAEATRRAAAILEVLAGVRGPSEAAAALRVSVNHYYLLERKALVGLVSACEPQPKGPRGPGLEEQVARLQRELDACRRECLRQAALVRATQRAVGLPQLPSPPPAGKASAGKATKRKGSGASSRRRRRPTVRALRAAQTLRKFCKSSSGEDPPEELKPASGQTNAAASSRSQPSGKEASHDGPSR